MGGPYSPTFGQQPQEDSSSSWDEAVERTLSATVSRIKLFHELLLRKSEVHIHVHIILLVMRDIHVLIVCDIHAHVIIMCDIQQCTVHVHICDIHVHVINCKTHVRIALYMYIHVV